MLRLRFSSNHRRMSSEVLPISRATLVYWVLTHTFNLSSGYLLSKLEISLCFALTRRACPRRERERTSSSIFFSLSFSLSSLLQLMLLLLIIIIRLTSNMICVERMRRSSSHPSDWKKQAARRERISQPVSLIDPSSPCCIWNSSGYRNYELSSPSKVRPRLAQDRKRCSLICNCVMKIDEENGARPNETFQT